MIHQSFVFEKGLESKEYVSVTGLKTKGFISRIRFWRLAVPAFRGAQEAEGILFCETKTRYGYHHPLTVWEEMFETFFGWIESD